MPSGASGLGVQHQRRYPYTVEYSVPGSDMDGEAMSRTPETGIGEQVSIAMDTDIDNIGRDLASVIDAANAGRLSKLPRRGSSPRRSDYRPTVRVKVTLGPLPVPEGVRRLTEFQSEMAELGERFGKQTAHARSLRDAGADTPADR